MQGNARIDDYVQRAVRGAPEFIYASYQDWYPVIKKRTDQLWREMIEGACRKLRLGEKTRLQVHRRKEVAANRLRLEHIPMSFIATDSTSVMQPQICH